MLIFGPKIFIPFVNGVKLPKCWLGIKFKFFKSIVCIFFVEKLKGGSDKVEILVAWNLDHLQQKSPK